MATLKKHWEKIYRLRRPEETSWYEKVPSKSLQLIAACKLAKSAAILDAGGGASWLPRCLLDKGYTNLHVLDISAGVIRKAKKQLGRRAPAIEWLVGDVLNCKLPDGLDLWHDRAVFHFLTRSQERRKYLRALKQSLKPGGFVILATFGPNGPSTCSGLPVRRYDAKKIQKEFGREFRLKQVLSKKHLTPWKTPQAFQYFLLQRKP